MVDCYKSSDVRIDFTRCIYGQILYACANVQFSTHFQQIVQISKDAFVKATNQLYCHVSGKTFLMSALDIITLLPSILPA